VIDIEIGDWVRIFKNKWFVRFASAEDIEDETLCKAIEDAEGGLLDADLGGGVIKQRIARKGEGASGGLRVIVLYRRGNRAFFVFGFSKNRMANIRKDELKAFKKLAKEMLALNDGQIESLKKAKALTEVMCNG
jgi:hypothetical protein